MNDSEVLIYCDGYPIAKVKGCHLHACINTSSVMGLDGC